jgi:hypothetical protein
VAGCGGSGAIRPNDVRVADDGTLAGTLGIYGGRQSCSLAWVAATLITRRGSRGVKV